jgi:lysophospholipase L1-like esterase
MLGDNWQVRNFGVPGATMLKKGDKPYWNQEAFRQVLAYDPHVVIVKLGTNDTKPQNWKHKDEFASDYRDMINCFEDLPAGPRIWICYPVPAYGERWGISDARIRNEVIPLLDRIAEQTNVAIIDLYKPLSNKSGLFPDRIHPNAQGAKLIAEEIYEVLDGKQVTDPELSNTRLKRTQRHHQPRCPKI